MKNNGFTLVEVVVSIVILALVVTGLVNIFLSSKRLALRTRSRMTGAELGKRFLDPLQSYIRQDTWAGSNCFNTNNPSSPANMAACPNVPTSYPIGSSVYTPQYFISDAGTDVKKVKVKITWPSE